MIFYTEVPPTFREKSKLYKRYYEVSAHVQASLIQKSIDIRCECINIGGSCVVFISALQIATSLIKCGLKKNILIVGASNNSTFLNTIDKNVCMAFGDGAAATIISTSGVMEVIDFFRMTDGEGFDAGFFKDYNSLIIDRKRITEFAPTAFKIAIDGILEKTKLKIDDIERAKGKLKTRMFSIPFSLRKFLKNPAKKSVEFIDLTNKKHKIIFNTIADIPMITGVLVFCKEKKALTKRGIKEEAKRPKEKMPKEAAVNLVSNQPNSPVPNINLTIWALNKNKKTETGIIRKRIWRKTEEKLSENFSFWSFAQVLDNAGKTAIAKETPIIPIGKY